MGKLMLVLMLAAAVPVAATECVTPKYKGVGLFTAFDAIFFARWSGETHYFTVEEVVRGNLEINDRIAHLPAQCVPLSSGVRYFVVRNCRDGECGLTVPHESQVPGLMKYLEEMHRETLRSVIDRTLAWQDGKVPLETYAQWLETAGVDTRNKDDLWVVDLVAELLDIVRHEPDADLSKFVELARRFPRESSPAFDAKIDDSVDEPMYWEDLAGELVDSLTKRP